MRSNLGWKLALIAAAVPLIAFLLINLMQQPSRGVKPAALTVGIGYESVSSDEVDWPGIRERLDRAGVDAVNVSVGRADFIGFPAEGEQEYWASGVEQGQDRVEEILDTLQEGSDRRVGLTVDVLAPRIVEQDDDYKAVFADGKPAEDFPSAVALHRGEVGDRVVEMCGATATRYSPDYIVLTELIGEAFFSEADEQLYRDMTGEDGFPRDAEGNIHIADNTLNDWQSDIIVGVIERCRDAAGVQVEMDARVNFDEPGSNRFESGHRYEDILATGSDLSLWAYTALVDESPDAISDVATGLTERFSPEELDRITIAVGLWGDLSNREVETSLRSGEGLSTVSYTHLTLPTKA